MLRRKPVAGALGIGGGRIVGVSDDKVLRGEVAVEGCAQKVQSAVAASGERDNVLPGTRIVSCAKGESGAVPCSM